VTTSYKYSPAQAVAFSLLLSASRELLSWQGELKELLSHLGDGKEQMSSSDNVWDWKQCAAWLFLVASKIMKLTQNYSCTRYYIYSWAKIELSFLWFACSCYVAAFLSITVPFYFICKIYAMVLQKKVIAHIVLFLDLVILRLNKINIFQD
jgi:hypothetical protein